MIFRNETTLEYLFYILNIKSTPPGIISTIELITPVRQSTTGTVEVENPLTVPTVFITECRVSDISLPTQLIVPPQAKVKAPGCFSRTLGCWYKAVLVRLKQSKNRNFWNNNWICRGKGMVNIAGQFPASGLGV